MCLIVCDLGTPAVRRTWPEVGHCTVDTEDISMQEDRLSRPVVVEQVRTSLITSHVIQYYIILQYIILHYIILQYIILYYNTL